MGSPETLMEDLERWRGGVDQKLESHEDDIRENRQVIANVQVDLGTLKVTVAQLAVKVGIGATIGSILGGALVAIVTGHIH